MWRQCYFETTHSSVSFTETESSVTELLDSASRFCFIILQLTWSEVQTNEITSTVVLIGSNSRIEDDVVLVQLRFLIVSLR